MTDPGSEFDGWEDAGREPTAEEIRDALAALEAVLDDDGQPRDEPPRRRTWWRRRP